MSEAGFKYLRVNARGRELSRQVMAEHIHSLTEEEFEAIRQGREPQRPLSQGDVACILVLYGGVQTEGCTQAHMKQKLNEILAKVYEP